MSKTTYEFNGESVIRENFNYAYSPHAKRGSTFRQYQSCVSNFAPENKNEFEYVSIISKKRYGEGTIASAKCAFGKFGAPLIVFTDDMTDDGDGWKLYGLHFEVVAYEGGCNVWHIVPDPSNEKRPIKPTRIGAAEFEILPDELIDICVKFGHKKISITINGNSFDVANEDFPERFNVGITACEGPNEFFEFTIEE